MSNKTQLLNHNERLASVIQTLQGKAAGGGGASAETVTISLQYKFPVSGSLYYVGETGAVETTNVDNTPASIVIQKNSILAMYQCWSSYSKIGDNAELLYYYSGCAAIYITGNTTLTFEG